MSIEAFDDGPVRRSDWNPIPTPDAATGQPWPEGDWMAQLDRGQPLQRTGDEETHPADTEDTRAVAVTALLRRRQADPAIGRHIIHLARRIRT